MLTILSAVFGFLTSLVPEVLKMKKDAMDKQHELQLFDKQMEFEKLRQDNTFKNLEVQLDAQQLSETYKTFYPAEKSASKWVVDLISSVRPVITYAFFGLFLIVELALVYKALTMGVPLHEAAIALWDEEAEILFATILGFWFGSRELQKLRK